MSDFFNPNLIDYGNIASFKFLWKLNILQRVGLEITFSNFLHSDFLLWKNNSKKFFFGDERQDKNMNKKLVKLEEIEEKSFLSK